MARPHPHIETLIDALNETPLRALADLARRQIAELPNDGEELLRNERDVVREQLNLMRGLVLIPFELEKDATDRLREIAPTFSIRKVFVTNPPREDGSIPGLAEDLMSRERNEVIGTFVEAWRNADDQIRRNWDIPNDL